MVARRPPATGVEWTETFMLRLMLTFNRLGWDADLGNDARRWSWLRKWYLVGEGKIGNKKVEEPFSSPSIIGDMGSERVPSTHATSVDEDASEDEVKEKEARASVRARYWGVWVKDRSSSKVWVIVPSCFKADFCGRERVLSSVGEDVRDDKDGSFLSAAAGADVSI
jgi:hypothetical protein